MKFHILNNNLCLMWYWKKKKGLRFLHLCKFRDWMRKYCKFNPKNN